MEKKHFTFLDGLRGFAALAVASLHASQVFVLRIEPKHAYLAVDFFFCLSGFVVAYAYDSRLKNSMMIYDFSIKRLIRLYPMIVAGIILGFIAISGRAVLEGKHQFPELIALAVSTFFLIPVGLIFHHQAFPIDNPIWSLFFELFANLMYAIERKFLRFRKILAIAALGVAALALLFMVHRLGTLQLVGFRSVKSFSGGFIRVIYPFFGGVLIYRYDMFNHRLRMHPAIPLAALLVILFCPFFAHSWIYDSGAIIIGFPLIVIFGAQSPNSKNLAILWQASGKLSYPFYIIHQPILWICYLLTSRWSLETQIPALFAVASLSAAGLLSYILLVIYDEPTRKLLSKYHRRSLLKTVIVPV